MLFPWASARGALSPCSLLWALPHSPGHSSVDSLLPPSPQLPAQPRRLKCVCRRSHHPHQLSLGSQSLSCALLQEALHDVHPSGTPHHPCPVALPHGTLALCPRHTVSLHLHMDGCVEWGEMGGYRGAGGEDKGPTDPPGPWEVREHRPGPTPPSEPAALRSAGVCGWVAAARCVPAVSSCCSDKLLQTWWLDRLRALEVRV